MSDTESIARDEFFEGLLGDFLDESGQLLDRLNENLLRLDEWTQSLEPGEHRRCDEQLLNEMFRSAHSLKGLSAMLGLKDINTLTHKVENVFDAARRDELAVTSDVVELIFQSLDRLTGLVGGLKDPTAEPPECESVLEGIRNLLQQAGAERQQTTQADAEKALQQTAPAAEAPPTGIPTPVEPATPAVSPMPCNQAPCAPAACAVRPVDVFAGLQDETEVPAKYLAIFIDETELSLDSLTETLLALEGGGSREAKESLLVISHRIKGSAASLGLNRAAKLSHLMEDLLQYLVDTGRALSRDMTDAMLMCTDALRQYVQGLRSSPQPGDRFAEVAHDLITARQSDTSSAPAVAASSAVTVSPASAVPPTAAEASRPATPPASVPVAAAATAAACVPPAVSKLSDTPATFAQFQTKLASILAEEEKATLGIVIFQPGLALAGLKARLVYEKLATLGELRAFEPPWETLEEMNSIDSVCFALATDKPISAVQQQLRIGGVYRTVVEPWQPLAAPAARPTAPASAAAPRGADASAKPAETAAKSTESTAKPAETLRVDIERLDQLMNMAGQLVISKARFTQIGDSLKNVLANKQSLQAMGNITAALAKFTAADAPTEAGDAAAELEVLRGTVRRIQRDMQIVQRDVAALGQVRTAVNGLFEAIHQLDRVADGIQRTVMDTRMVPIGPLFTRFKRVVRDITRANGKLVNLVINGEKTELDKRMIDELGDPLIHMVRNSADHGIEPPEVRRAAGKPELGTITLNAFHRGNNIVIQVCDDGKGLDAERIRRKAIERGLITEADADRMSRQQLYQLIWEPGLSTAEKVTEVSGRGMGMDIVRSKIEDLHGTVELDSAPGQGTTMTIKLPLTLAILPSLMVDIAGDVFAMPLEAVEEIVRVGRENLNTVHGKWTAAVRGRVISVVRLGDVFSWSGSSSSEEVNLEDTSLVIIGEAGCELGLAVDRVLGEEDVVIKSLAENYRNVPGVAGASILGDGRVSLILDVAALIEMSSGRNVAAMSGAVGRT